MLGGRLGLASLYSWVGWEGGQGGPITVVREGMWGITRLRFFIRGEYSALGCVDAEMSKTCLKILISSFWMSKLSSRY